MKAAPVQQHLDRFPCQTRSLQLTTSFKFAAVLSTGLAAVSLLLANPAFGQTTKAMTFEQKPYVGKASEMAELQPVKRTALFNPELDGMLASGLLWTSYLSLPIAVIVAVRWHDQHTREQMAKLVQQIATLERIWQHPQAR